MPLSSPMAKVPHWFPQLRPTVKLRLSTKSFISSRLKFCISFACSIISSWLTFVLSQSDTSLALAENSCVESISVLLFICLNTVTAVTSAKIMKDMIMNRDTVLVILCLMFIFSIVTFVNILIKRKNSTKKGNKIQRICIDFVIKLTRRKI